MSQPDDTPITLGGGAEVRESKVTDWVGPSARPVDPDWPSTWTANNSATILHKFQGIDELVGAVRSLTGAVRVLNRDLREMKAPTPCPSPEVHDLIDTIRGSMEPAADEEPPPASFGPGEGH